MERFRDQKRYDNEETSRHREPRCDPLYNDKVVDMRLVEVAFYCHDHGCDQSGRWAAFVVTSVRKFVRQTGPNLRVINSGQVRIGRENTISVESRSKA